jgi:NAD dependent epimerase/dehydratase family enzyme
MKIIITGGMGMIGRALARPGQRRSRGDYLPASPSRGRFTGGIRWKNGTGAPRRLGKLADGADAIVNLAGENLSAGRWTAKRKRAIWKAGLRLEPRSCRPSNRR